MTDIDEVAERCYWASYDEVSASADYTDPKAATSAGIKAAVNVGFGVGHAEGVEAERDRIVKALRMWAVGSPEVLRAVGLIERGEL